MLVGAHRGSSASAPENTMAAFRLAVDEGAELIELDVRFTRDMHPVIHHDRTLRRTTNGRGRLWQHTLAELQELDAGAWFHPRFAGERIPMLADVLEWLPSRIVLNIELKTDGDPRPLERRLQSLMSVIDHWRTSRTVILSSFDHHSLRRLHRMSPALHIGVLYHPVRNVAARPSRLAAKLGAGYFICGCSQLRRRLSRDAHTHGVRLAVYGVATEAHLRRALLHHADAVIVNDPAAIRRLLHKR
jgi:glycerophosphoryl diester phosphodiesterase